MPQIERGAGNGVIHSAQFVGGEDGGILIPRRLSVLNVVFRLGKLIGGGIFGGLIHRRPELVIDRRDDLRNLLLRTGEGGPAAARRPAQLGQNPVPTPDGILIRRVEIHRLGVIVQSLLIVARLLRLLAQVNQALGLVNLLLLGQTVHLGLMLQRLLIGSGSSRRRSHIIIGQGHDLGRLLVRCGNSRRLLVGRILLIHALQILLR